MTITVQTPGAPGTEARLYPRRAWRLRDRFFIVLTANVAWLGAWATPWLIEESQILEVNSARAFLMLLMPRETPAVSPAGNPSGNGADASEAMTPEQLRKLVERQIPAVEAVVFIWKRVMWGVAALVGFLAMLAAMTGWVRGLHLVAAAVILLSTVATLVAMQFLIHPDYGGMEPLPIRSHVYVALCQSAYAWLLLLTFVRRPRQCGADGGVR